MTTRTGFSGFLFDMDGTLLHTLPDLVVVTNKVLERQGFPLRSEKEILGFIGDGVLSLIKQAVPEGSSKDIKDRAFDEFRVLHSEYGVNLTRPFDGMEESLRTLKQYGKKLGIMSNKFERGVKDVERRYFPGLFDVSHGETKVVLRKPEPIGLLMCAQEMGLDPSQCVYFGDSHGDMLAAHNAGMYAVGVTWGYQPLERLKQGNPDELIDSPAELLKFM